MPLRLSLKPNEKFVIGNAVIENEPKSATFLILNKTTILREKDILTEETANTPAKRIYFIVQLMYLTGSMEESKEQHPVFFNLTKQFLAACPTPEVFEVISDVGELILNDNFYAALKRCKELIKYEKEILEGGGPEPGP